MPVIRQAALPFSVIAREFVGERHGAEITFLLVDAAPGDGPRLHRHPYQEVIITQAGAASFRLGEQQLHVTAGDIVVVPAGVAHAFRATGPERLRQIDIHLSPRFVTEWLEGEE